MAISSNTTGLRPGVCTSTTRPTAPYEGQMIYETDTDKVLVWNNSAWKQIPTAATAGTVLQVVEGFTTTQTSISSTTAYADTGLTATITPSSTSSKVLVIVNQAGCYKQTDVNASVNLKLFRGASEIAFHGSIGFNNSSAINTVGSASMIVFDSPSTTSATIYKTQYANTTAASGVVVQYASSRSSIILVEIAG